MSSTITRYSYRHGICPEPLLGETIGLRFKKIVEQYGEQEALICMSQNVRLTYQQLWDQSTIVAKALLAKGITRGDRVGLWSPNRYEWIVILYATARIGVILVNLNPAFEFHELLFVMDQCKMKLLITVVMYQQNDHLKIVDKAKSKVTSLEDVIFFDHHSWEEFLQLAALKNDDVVQHVAQGVQFDDPVNIQYTSGTTGSPKGVTLSHHNILNNGYFTGRRMHYSNKDRVCLPIPLFHSFSMVLGALGCCAHGATLVLLGEQFTPLKMLEAVHKERCTSILAVPTMFINTLQHPDFNKFDLTCLRTGIMGGAICPIETMKQVQSKMHMKEITICFGMTETSPTSTQTVIGTPIERQVSTVGFVADHLEAKVIDPNTGDIVPCGVEGEYCARGYAVMLKYWEAPEATNAVIDSARWMHSGDLVVMDEEGYITVTGRIKDIIIRGGENISPKEIEEHLYTHETVSEVQVIGVPSDIYGEEVMAWVKLIDGCTVTAQELKEYCRRQFASYKVPRYWKFVDKFPTTLSGKIRKVEMREVSAKELASGELAKYKIEDLRPKGSNVSSPAEVKDTEIPKGKKSANGKRARDDDN